MIRVAIVDDHLVARYGLMAILSAEPDIEVVAAMSAPTGLVRLGVDQANVLICDPFPVGEAPWLDALREVAATVPVLVVSASRNQADVSAALRAGVLGYVTKQAGDETFATAIRAVAAGRRYMPGPVTEALASADRAGPQESARAPLSDREQEALAYISSGFTHQTARRMGVSKATVDTYVARIRTKLRIGNKAELALAALRHVEPRHRLSVAVTGHRPPAAAA
jgi:DNA-binding NarL/FixJ family response regulator